MSTKVTLSLRVDERVKQRLKQIAQKERRSASFVANEALSAFCDKSLKALAKAPRAPNEALTEVIEIPAFIDLDLWNEFMAIRKKVKAVNSPRAIKMLINKLVKFAEHGHDANELIKKSIVNSWKDIYEPDQRAQAGKPSSVERFNSESQNWINANLYGAGG